MKLQIRNPLRSSLAAVTPLIVVVLALSGVACRSTTPTDPDTEWRGRIIAEGSVRWVTSSGVPEEWQGLGEEPITVSIDFPLSEDDSQHAVCRNGPTMTVQAGSRVWSGVIGQMQSVDDDIQWGDGLLLTARGTDLTLSLELHDYVEPLQMISTPADLCSLDRVAFSSVTSGRGNLISSTSSGFAVYFEITSARRVR